MVESYRSLESSGKVFRIEGSYKSASDSIVEHY